MSAFYGNLDLYLNTSIHEGMPMSVLEAMACWLPVIAPNVGGFKEIIDDGIQVHLIDGRDPEKYAAKCISLYNDRETLHRMAIAARAKVERDFSIERTVNDYRNLYLTAAGYHA